MLGTLKRHWWLLVLRGLAAVLFGVLAFIWPNLALASLVLLFGAYALVDGVLTIIAAFRRTDTDRHWWVLLLEGVVGILAGVAAFVWPGLTALALLYLIAAWAIITGIFEIIAAVRLREEIEGEFWLGLGGLLSLIFGILLVLMPGPGALAVVWLIAGYAIAFGVLLVILGFRVRQAPAIDRAHSVTS